MILRLSTTTFTEILLRILVEGFLAAGGTEVIRLPFVLRCTRRGRRVNIHSTNGVMYGICHINHLLLVNQIIALTRWLQEEQNCLKEHMQFCLSVGRACPINSRSCRLDQAPVEVIPCFADPDAPCWTQPRMRISRSLRVLHPHL